MPIFVYTTRFINIISFMISMIIYLFINLCINHVDIPINKVQFTANFTVQEDITQKDPVSSNYLEENMIENANATMEEKTEEEEAWYIQIDKIGLKAPIQEGTTQQIMEDFVGHFEESSKDFGNVCLAAHNRGYKNNYFSRIKELQEGDEIRYKYKNIEKTYIVTKHEIIENTDWSNLERTEENKITLITCVENEPEYRRCIQGIEK